MRTPRSLTLLRPRRSQDTEWLLSTKMCTLCCRSCASCSSRSAGLRVDKEIKWFSKAFLSDRSSESPSRNWVDDLGRGRLKWAEAGEACGALVYCCWKHQMRKQSPNS